MPDLRSTHAFRTDLDANGRPMSAQGREKLLEPYLPAVRQHKPLTLSHSTSQKRFHHKQRVRPVLQSLLHLLLFTLIHAVFSVYIRVRQVYHAIVDRTHAIAVYHHRTPEHIRRDVKRLSKVPQHLSVVLELQPEGTKKDRLESLVNEACEVTAWSACAGVPMLSIYEKTGVLKTSLQHLHRRINKTLTAYYGSSPLKPTISLRAPHHESFSPPHSPGLMTNGDTGRPHLTILLISATDGRQTIVDLTRTLATMAQDDKLRLSDISQELVNAELMESVMGEPDLLILFGDRLVLDGYPPWQVRLSEIYSSRDSTVGVGYSVFIRALYRYARAEMRIGR
ncbi:hypothetical protein LTR62_004979 [Meristemomyces frigidus]|uniref:ditrans,polycis-polyprenyl diphosphate synthase [(2E,6E)-farnesyldiphosphate specific] n=1 Tax=Meristemomyces frigidus TaxID=1508187 RepID=A0AAN7YMX2_9PEZI|nr:hypothetical protein LTR62_004979 [Meristemomyces frigidus]